MFKFGLGSMAGTALDFLIFRFVLVNFMPVFYADLGAAFSGMIVNFFMHKQFVFTLDRKPGTAFILSVAFSFFSMFLGAWALSELSQMPYFFEHLTLAKLSVMGCKFGFNYFTKRWIFERYWVTPKKELNSVLEKK